MLKCLKLDKYCSQVLCHLPNLLGYLVGTGGGAGELTVV